MVKSLCTQYSPPLVSIPAPIQTASRMLTPSESDGTKSGPATPEPELESYHPFPSPSRLSSPDVSAMLRSLGFGYRADFIQKTAKMLCDAHGAGPSSKGKEGPERWLYTLRKMTTTDARQELLKLMGVGRKVADCTLLMSLDKPEVIPVDTHVHQIATKHYGFRGASGTRQTMSPKLYEAISERFYNMWGEYAGWAHSVLFTADLKAFADYGLLTPIPSPRKAATSSQAPEGYLSVPIQSSRKRRIKQVHVQDALEQRSIPRREESPMEGSSLLERVKKRRRASYMPR